MDLSKLSVSEMRKIYKETESVIFGRHPCFGVSDLRLLTLLGEELQKRKSRKPRKLC